MIESRTLLPSVLKTGAVALLLYTVAFSSYASDGDRITQLEKEVQELKLRLSTLESQQASSSNRQKPVASSEGWKYLVNWRSLKKGMTYDEVRATLGEPERIQGGTIAFWIYSNRGSVTFYEDRLDRWTEPR